MDVSTVIALGGAIAFVAVFLYYQRSAKPVAKAIVGYTEAELAALSSGKKPKKKAAPAKDKKAVSPKTEKKSDAKPAPTASRRLKNVDGAADHDTDEEMLSFLSNKITLETKRKNAEAEQEEDKPKSKKGAKEPVVAEKPAAGFTAVVEKKKPAKKEAEEPAANGEEKKEEAEKKRAKSFFKADADEEKRAAEARKAEWEARKKEKETGVRVPRPPRDPNAPRPPPRQRPEGEGSTEEGGAPARPPRQYPPMATPTHTDMFEQWSIDSLLDSITAAPAEKNVKRGGAPRAATNTTATAAAPEESAADAAQE